MTAPHAPLFGAACAGRELTRRACHVPFVFVLHPIQSPPLNTVQCTPGLYLTTDNTCKPKRQYCTSKGMYLQQTNATTDNVCLPCPSGQYQDTMYNTKAFCKPKRTSCPPGQYTLVLSNNVYADNTCIGGLTLWCCPLAGHTYRELPLPLHRGAVRVVRCLLRVSRV